jgi:hypothetical protein
MTLIDLTIEDENAVERAKQMLSGVDIEGSERVRLVVESKETLDLENVEEVDLEELYPDTTDQLEDADEPEPAGDSGN